MPHPLLAETLDGWPSAALAIVGSCAVAVLALWIARRVELAGRLFRTYPSLPAPIDRVRQMAACADYARDYGLAALPDFPACASDPVLARAAAHAVQTTDPEPLGAALDDDLYAWLLKGARRGQALRRAERLLPVIGLVGLLVGFLGVGAVAGGWFAPGFVGGALLLVSTLAGILATAVGSTNAHRPDHTVAIDPAAVLDRKIIGAAMVEIRRGTGPREIEVSLAKFLPATDRTALEVQARAA